MWGAGGFAAGKCVRLVLLGKERPGFRDAHHSSHIPVPAPHQLLLPPNTPLTHMMCSYLPRNVAKPPVGKGIGKKKTKNDCSRNLLMPARGARSKIAVVPHMLRSTVTCFPFLIMHRYRSHLPPITAHPPPSKLSTPRCIPPFHLLSACR